MLVRVVESVVAMSVSSTPVDTDGPCNGPTDVVMRRLLMRACVAINVSSPQCMLALMKLLMIVLDYKIFRLMR